MNHQDSQPLISESCVYVEGRVTKKNSTPGTTVPFINNPASFLFSEVRLEVSGTTVDSTKYLGVTSTMKALVSYSPNESNKLQMSGWVAPAETTIKPNSSGDFDFYIPLKLWLGIAEDYKHIFLGQSIVLILRRSATDNDAIIAPEGTTEQTLDWKLELLKVSWRVPHVRLSDKHRLTMLKQINSDEEIVLAFRSWETHYYPLLPTTRKHSWTIKSSNYLERIRYLLFGLQENRSNSLTKDAGLFDNCGLVSCTVYVNEKRFPYDSLQVSFKKKRITRAYAALAGFQSSYFSKTDFPLLTPTQFAEKYAIIVVDCSKQNESIKSSVVDVRVEFETEENIPASTSAYACILHDKVVTYTPLTGVVRHVA